MFITRLSPPAIKSRLLGHEEHLLFFCPVANCASARFGVGVGVGVGEFGATGKGAVQAKWPAMRLLKAQDIVHHALLPASGRASRRRLRSK